MVRRRAVAARGRGGGKGGERERGDGGELSEVHAETGYWGLNCAVRVRIADGLCASLLCDSVQSGKYFVIHFGNRDQGAHRARAAQAGQVWPNFCD